ncbi:MAG TPA: FHA domain-containing protein [Pirellulales bacterium]|jgi:adenylate cyclase|nr:FHA domain-containing protein [Pirellulales bacterium]
MFGELLPTGGGDPIPLLKKQLQIGRRESCDIVLRFQNVSAHHCELSIQGGYWHVRDSNSRNGIKVNDNKVQEKRLLPGDILSVAKHNYEIQYVPADLGAIGPPPAENLPNDIMEKSLLERAGLAPKNVRGSEGPKRYDPGEQGPDSLKNKYRDPT